MKRITNAQELVKLLNKQETVKVLLNSEPDGEYYFGIETENGSAIVPFADGSIEIYNKDEWRKK